MAGESVACGDDHANAVRRTIVAESLHLGAQFSLLREETRQPADRLAGVGQRGRGVVLCRAPAVGVRRHGVDALQPGRAGVARQPRVCRNHVQSARQADRREAGRRRPALSARDQDRIRGRRRNLSRLALRRPSGLFQRAGRRASRARPVRPLRQGEEQSLSVLVRPDESLRRRAGARISLVGLAGVHRAGFLRGDRRRRSDLHAAAPGKIGGTPLGDGPAGPGAGFLRRRRRPARLSLRSPGRRHDQQPRHAAAVPPADGHLARLGTVRHAGVLRDLERRGVGVRGDCRRRPSWPAAPTGS